MENPNDPCYALKIINNCLKELLNDKEKIIEIQEELISEYRKEVWDLTNKLNLMVITFSEN